MTKTDKDVDRLERRALPTQFARRRRKMRPAGLTLPFLGVVTSCSRDIAGTTTIAGKKLTRMPYEFMDGEVFTAFAGTDAAIIRDSMVLVWPLISPTDDNTVRYYALPHVSVTPGHLTEPDDPACMAFLNWRWDQYIDPTCANPENNNCPADPCEPEP